MSVNQAALGVEERGTQVDGYWKISWHEWVLDQAPDKQCVKLDANL